MEKYLIISAVLVLLLAGSVNAIEANSLNIENVITENNTVQVTMTFIFNETISEFSYPLSFIAKNLNVVSNYEISRCEVVSKGTVSDISCNFLGLKEAKPFFKFSFDVENPRLEENKYSVFYYTIFPIKEATSKITLPPRSLLANDDTSKSFSPTGAEISTDGRTITLSWEKNNLAVGDNLGFTVFYTSSEPPADLIGYIIILVIIIIAAVFLWTIIHSKRTKVKSQQIVVSVLNPDEKKLYDILVSHDGKCNQKVLVRESNFSKAKVSRVVKDLKQRGIVDIEPVSGRENRIILKIKLKME